MAARAEKFAEGATVNDLKEKLGHLGLPVTGNKTALKLRLLESIPSLSEGQFQEHFPENLLSLMDNEHEITVVGNLETSENGAENSNDDVLDAELQILRERVAKRLEIAELKRKLSELTLEENLDSASSRSFVNFRDVEESLIQFSGDNSYSVHRWLQQFEESAEILGWDSRMRLIYAKRLMKGTAKHFLRTTIFKSWNELKTSLIKEFSRKVTSAEIHNQLRNRKKKSEETIQQYVFSMQEIASLTNIEESDLIEYIINGIPDSNVNKMLLFNANNMDELKLVLHKYGKIKLHTTVAERSKLRPNAADSSNSARSKYKCFNCNGYGHLSSECPKPRRDRGSCFRCGKSGHKYNECTDTRKQVMTCQDSSDADELTQVQDLQQQQQIYEYVYFNSNNFEFNTRYSYGKKDGNEATFTCSLWTLLDSGSAVSFVQEQFIPANLVTVVDPEKYKFQGINGSQLQVLGLTRPVVSFKNKCLEINLFVVKNESMKYSVILGRDFFKMNELEITCKNDNQAVNDDVNRLQNQTQGNCNEIINDEILNINTFDDDIVPTLNVNEGLPFEIKKRMNDIVTEANIGNGDNSGQSAKQFEMVITLTKDEPFYCTPRRLPYTQKLELKKILDDLLERKIIRESNSPYASPIALVSRKNRELRLCLDFRESNRFTVRDNYPLPVIEDLLDRLRNKKHKAPHKYNDGDFIMIKNIDTTPGINKKLLPEYREPYKISKVLRNDRYIIEDIDGNQLTRLPYNYILVRMSLVGKRL